ncbi:MAG: S46 family peptidase [Prolixibacteraceae bacterium]|nr:S46 family peptidase [Prolixibacteraceae bacterium]
MIKFKLLFTSVFFTVSTLFAGEGMWMPLLLEKYNLSEMQELGFRLTPQDIYDINSASMKDAVVIFGGGCTGEMISGDGLLLTNHHCGYRNIQYHSEVGRDYLTDGFWAMSREEELPNPGLTVSFLEYMKDVTDEVLQGTAELKESEREVRIKVNSDRIIKEASDGGTYSAVIKSLYYGNQYYLYVNKVYRDVRLVGAPPSAIGKFGGDTDNWMWPRHTGDFSLFRVYADENNEPAGYSPENVPFKPKKHFTLSVKGIKHGDFTMILGYPGRTMQYLPSHEVELIMDRRDPARISIRDKKLKIIDSAMQSDPAIRIQYAAKHASISNAWKKWQGEIAGLKRLDAVKKKIVFEQEFKNFAMSNSFRKDKYEQVFENFDGIYPVYGDYIEAGDYYSEIIFNGVEIFRIAAFINNLVNNIENKQDQRVEQGLSAILDYLALFFKDYNQSVDEELFTTLLPVLANDLDSEFLPSHLDQILSKSGEDKLVKRVYRRSVLPDHGKMRDLLKEADENKLLRLRNDPVVKLYNRMSHHYEMKIKPVVDSLSQCIESNMKIYMAGITEMNRDSQLYPDANGTMRFSYGVVEGYEPRDGVKYKYYTTLDGIMDKDNREIYDYNVPQRLRELYESRDFGRYAEDGYMPVCFTASNHTTGGNSGSPVVNGKGELAGINFDRCWEGTMSDIMFDPEVCRNIAVDIRYVLFLIDKFAGAGYLLEEMDINY